MVDKPTIGSVTFAPTRLHPYNELEQGMPNFVARPVITDEMREVFMAIAAEEAKAAIEAHERKLHGHQL